MTLGDAVKARLLAITALSSLVDSRVYETVLPQNERRASVRYHVIGSPHDTHIRGPVNQYEHRVQIDAYQPVQGSTDPIADARAIAAAIRGNGLGAESTGIKGWNGIVGGSPDEPIQIIDVFVLNDGDVTYENDEQLRVRVRQDFRIQWRYVLDA